MKKTTKKLHLPPLWTPQRNARYRLYAACFAIWAVLLAEDAQGCTGPLKRYAFIRKINDTYRTCWARHGPGSVLAWDRICANSEATFYRSLLVIYNVGFCTVVMWRTSCIFIGISSQFGEVSTIIATCDFTFNLDLTPRPLRCTHALQGKNRRQLRNLSDPGTRRKTTPPRASAHEHIYALVCQYCNMWRANFYVSSLLRTLNRLKKRAYSFGPGSNLM